jgi:hypothetical protein
MLALIVSSAGLTRRADLFDQLEVGMEVFCRPTSLPQLCNIESNKMLHRREGIYTIVKAWYPDTWRFPGIQFIECEDDDGIAVFCNSEVVVSLDGF